MRHVCGARVVLLVLEHEDLGIFLSQLLPNCGPMPASFASVSSKIPCGRAQGVKAARGAKRLVYPVRLDRSSSDGYKL